MGRRSVGVLAGIGSLLLRGPSASPDLEENLRAARWTLGLTHGGTAAAQCVHAAFNPVLAACMLGLCALSFAWLLRAYLRAARVLREEEVRRIMES